MQEFLVLPILYLIVFVLHGASFKVFDTEGKIKKLFKGCTKWVARLLFVLPIWYLAPFGDLYSFIPAGIAFAGFAAGMGYYAELHNGITVPNASIPTIDRVVRYVVEKLKVETYSVNHGRVGLAVKGLVMGHVLYLLGWEVKRQLVLYTDVNNEWAHLVQEAFNGFLYGVILYGVFIL